MSDLYVKTKTVSRGNMYAYEFTVYHRTKRLRTFDTIPEARKYIDAVEQGMRLAVHSRVQAGRTSGNEITVTIPRATAEQFALPLGRTASTPHTTVSRPLRAQALETVRGLVYLQLNRPTVPAEADPPSYVIRAPSTPPIRLRAKPEGHPHTILADAVNQLAIEVEYIAASTHCNHEGDRVRRIQKIRSTLTALIPE